MAKKVDHLIELGKNANNCDVHLFEGDLFKKGAMTKPFLGCAAVIHAGATVVLTERLLRKYTMVASQK